MIHSLAILDVEPHPNNPRQDLGDLTELADSIRAVGVLQPITVVPHPDNATAYRCLLGHRRLAASKLAGVQLVPAIIREGLSESDQVVEMGVENIHRDDLTPVEEATWLQDILDLGTVKRSQLSKVTGLSKTTVSSRLKLAALPSAAKVKVHAGQVTLEDAMKLADAAELLDADAYAKVVAALGTLTFSWELADSVRAAQTAKSLAAALEQLAAIGVEVVEKVDPYDFVYVGQFPGNEFTGVNRVDLTADMVATARPNTGSAGIYRPRLDEDKIVREAPWEASNKKREEDLAAARPAVETAWALRTEFILDRTMRSTPVDGEYITRAFTALVIYDATFDETNMARWLNAIDADTMLDNFDAAHEVADILAATPERVMLAVLAAHFEMAGPDDGVVDQSWGLAIPRRIQSAIDGWSAHADIVTWYEILEKLGYVPSEWERAQLTPPPADVDDVEAVAS